MRTTGAAVTVGLVLTGVSAGSSVAATSTAHGATHKVHAQPAVNLKGVTLNVGDYLYDGWETELQSAGLNNTPYKVNYDGLNSGFLQLDAIESGSTDLGGPSFIAAIFAGSSPAASSFKLAAEQLSNTEDQDVIVPGSSSDTSVNSLVGQTVGYITSTTSEFFLAKALENAGLSWKSINAVAFQTPATGLAALENGSIQALSTYGTTIQTAEGSLGAKVLIDGGPILAKAGGFNGLLAEVAVATSDLSNPSKEAAIADYIARLNVAAAWARNHAGAWSNIVSLATQGTTTYSEEFHLFTAGEKAVPTHFLPVSRASIAGEQRAANTLAAAGLLPGRVNVGPLWTTALNTLVTKDIATYEAKYKSLFPVALP